MSTGSAHAGDGRAELVRAATWLAQGGTAKEGRGVTSDLSIDEALLVHSMGWEPIELAFGVSVASIPQGVWTWGRGEIAAASDAHNLAVHTASERLAQECAKAGGHGVVGVRVSVQVTPNHVNVELTGTAVRPVSGK
ncbi:MAG: heavy metal-binding domain-containing protein, partial [Acidimicrobiales bacterium]